MNSLCQKLRAVDISKALAALSETAFRDTGGTNGWIANPSWLMDFVNGLHLNGMVSRVVCRKLPPGLGIPPHIDLGRDERRFHVPLVTHPGVTMRWPDDGVEVHLEAGYLYEVNFTKLHEIVNHAPVDRVHVQVNVVDTSQVICG